MRTDFSMDKFTSYDLWSIVFLNLQKLVVSEPVQYNYGQFDSKMAHEKWPICLAVYGKMLIVCLIIQLVGLFKEFYWIEWLS